MTIEQTVEIPVTRRIFLDLPQNLPPGKARIEVRVIPAAEVPPLSLMDLYGSCAGEDTLEAYFERKRADKMLEAERFNPRFNEPDA
ncbi:MAG: hypothetical protein LBF83_00185 [Spirochaetaceae bacterium]|jgi:hypothetical protein|nr:hypothetical protein [Spirochaetaceae bacterium]